MSTPEQIIADAIWSTLEAQEEPVGGPWVDRDMRMIDSSGSEVNMAAAVSAALAALKDARYHVVKLPEPDHVYSKRNISWRVLVGDEPEDVYMRDDTVCVSGHASFDVRDVPDLAAALLAAHAAAADSAEDTK